MDFGGQQYFGLTHFFTSHTNRRNTRFLDRTNTISTQLLTVHTRTSTQQIGNSDGPSLARVHLLLVVTLISKDSLNPQNSNSLCSAESPASTTSATPDGSSWRTYTTPQVTERRSIRTKISTDHQRIEHNLFFSEFVVFITIYVDLYGSEVFFTQPGARCLQFV